MRAVKILAVHDFVLEREQEHPIRSTGTRNFLSLEWRDNALHDVATMRDSYWHLASLSAPLDNRPFSTDMSESMLASGMPCDRRGTLMLQSVVHSGPTWTGLGPVLQVLQLLFLLPQSMQMTPLHAAEWLDSSLFGFLDEI